MKIFVTILLLIFILVSCKRLDNHTWQSKTNGPPAQMAEKNQDIDEDQWPPDNRTGNPAYHLRKQKERRDSK